MPGGARLTGSGDPEQVRIVRVSDGTLRALGVVPALGRWFSREDDTPGTPETVILGHGLWQRRFGGDAAIVGRTVTVDSLPRTVIGVMPPGFAVVNQVPDLLLPYRFDRTQLYLGNFSHYGIVRLKPGVSLEAANADVARMLDIWLDSWPLVPGMNVETFRTAGVGPRLHPLKSDVVGDVGPALWLLLGTLAFVLLIACANVANLLLVRAHARQQELAIRAALGAGWRRIARGLLLESAILGLLGGAFGLGLAAAILRVLPTIGPGSVPRLGEISIDTAAVIFVVVISLASSLLFGVAPVLRYASRDVVHGLRSDARTFSADRDWTGARNALAVVQVALALVLLVGSGLMIRTLQALLRIHPGFDGPAAVQMARINIPPAHVAQPEDVMRLQRNLLDRLTGLPGVRAVALTTSAPMEAIEGFDNKDAIFVDGRVYQPDEIPPLRQFKFVSPGFFETAGIPILAGRDLMWSDLEERREVALVSENLARELWGNPAAALGQRIRETPVASSREIVGVVGDVRDDGVHRPARTTVYWPVMMDGFWGQPIAVQRAVALLIRSDRAGTESFLAELRAAVWAVSPDLPLARVRTLDDLYQSSMGRTRFILIMLAIAGVMALALGIVGLYAVLSFSAEQRKREVGIRLALGAEPRAVRWMFVRQGLALTGNGLLVGAAAALALTQLMTSQLFGVSPFDPVAYAAAFAILALAATAANYIPAHRSTRIDPIHALRED